MKRFGGAKRPDITVDCDSRRRHDAVNMEEEDKEA
jgi:hypothetical protein